MKISINVKMVVLLALLVAIPGATIGYLGYKSSEKAVYDGVADRLMDQANDWRMLVQAYNEEITAQEIRVHKSAENIVTAQAKMTYELIDKTLKDNGGKLPDNVKEDLLNRINRNTVGNTGYIWILDPKANYILSKGRQRDGENIWEAKDASGDYMAQRLVKKGMELTGSAIAIDTYFWQNKGEEKPREKIAAMVYFPELQWIVGASTYFDDLVDMSYRERTIEKVKNMMAAQPVGKTGYVWVLDSKGNYIVFKGRQRDGESLWEAKDNDGVPFVQEMIRKGKAAGAKGTDYQVYPWKNKDESSPRMKVSGFAYIPEMDWLIGLGSYYDDFQGNGALGVLKKNIYYIFFGSLFIAILLVLVFALMITKPLKRMTEAANKIVGGDLNVELPDVRTHDEVEDLNMAFSMLIGAIKFMRGEKDAKKNSKNV